MNKNKWYKIKYVGESFGVDELTNGKVYCAIDDGEDMYRVVDDSGEDYLYDKINPKPTDDSSKGGKWEVVETIPSKELDRKLKYVSNIDEKLNKNITPNEIKNNITKDSIDNKEKIVDYLYKGKIVLMLNNVKEDVIDNEMGSIGAEIWRTDGIYKWSSSLVYYFVNYNLQLSKEFISYVNGKI